MILNNTEIYKKIIQIIIIHQESIIGPLAWSEAESVQGLIVENNTIQIKGNEKKIVEELVRQYKNLFGQASVEACKDAIKESQLSLSPSDLPEILQ